ncbi:MAG: desulfoferrodoxin [Ruminiclostridium sp.]|nr:desulfoferrodoxin [Ruminiclostridium sp.]MBR5792510.1 desulfoferrodoxin [Ruminiclostridium sp.]
MKFFKCNHCGNIVSYVQDNGPKVICCGEEMVELVPKTADSAVEKHVPVVEVEGNLVKVIVGSTLHPMAEEHSIQWIALETEQGEQLKYLKPGQEPVVTFQLVPGDKVVAAYEYCNLHGLWKA